MKIKILMLIAIVVVIFTALGGCASDADVASQNISTKADNFQVKRHIVFINTITDKYLLEIVGLCSLGNSDKAGELTVTCKTGADSYKKHFLGLSATITYVVEQIDGSDVDPYHYEIIFKPEEIIPDIRLKTSDSNNP